MKRTFLRSIAVSSLLIATLAMGATRPRYGGTLRISTATTLASVDPADSSQVDWTMRRNLAHLLFDTLTVLDARGFVQPSVADSWTSASNQQHWQFNLRRGVTVSDGAPLIPEVVAASLRRANAAWKVTALPDAISIDLETPSPNLPAELALPRNSIVKRSDGLLGTGPFVISHWEQGKKITLMARDDYWGGRVFLDAIEIETGKSLRDQAIALELGRTDLIEISPEQARRAATIGRRVVTSSPEELMALWFTRDVLNADESRLREALSLSIDRTQLNRIFLQGDGEAAGGVLPSWISGYEFLFPSDANLTRAKQLRSEVRQPRNWTMGYDRNDPLAQLVAERVMLNARDAGLSITPNTAPGADIRLVRIPLASLDPQIAFGEAAASLAAATKDPGVGTDGLYFAENALLQLHRVIPLLHLRTACGIGANAQGFVLERDGSWNLSQTWLAAGRP